MQEPGLDRHEWESQWASLEPSVLESPREALPDLDDLVTRMLEERGYALDEPVTREGDDPEILKTYLAAHEVRMRVDRDDEDLSPGDVAAAIENYRDLETAPNGLKAVLEQEFVHVTPASQTRANFTGRLKLGGGLGVPRAG